MSDFAHTPNDSIGLQFWKVSQRWQKQIAKALRPYGLTHTQYVIPAAIRWHQEQSINPSQTDISKLINIEKMTLSKAIRKLEEAGLLTRKTATSDTRSKSITLSDGNTLQSAIQAVEQVDKKFFACLPGNRPENLLEILAILDNQQTPNRGKTRRVQPVIPQPQVKLALARSRILSVKPTLNG